MNNGNGTGSGYGSGAGNWTGNGDGDGSGDGSGDGYGDGSGDGYRKGDWSGDVKEREKIELNILNNLKDSDLPLFINIWEFPKNKDLFEKRLKKIL